MRCVSLRAVLTRKCMVCTVLMRLTRGWGLAAALIMVGAGSLGADSLYYLDIGLNFTGSTLSDSWFIPPDTMGAVGQDHIVELINGQYAVYDKNDGSSITSSTLNAFWTGAGVSYAGSFTFDPRVVYDPFSERWFASSVDNGGAANNFLIAVSKSSDPTVGWAGFAIDSDSDDSHWADFDMLGFDADGVYISANMYTLDSGSTDITIVAIPKADLVAGTPTVANTTMWEEIVGQGYSHPGYSLQPIVDMDNGGLSARLLSAYNTGAGRFKRSSITGSIASPTLDTSSVLIPVGAYSDPPDAAQPGPKADIETNETRLSSNVVLCNGSLWGVQTVESSSRAALRWFEIDEATNALLQEGLIADPDFDYYFGSIAVNLDGIAVIGFSGSSESQYVSTYAVLGETQGGATTFTDPLLLVAGVADYQRLDSISRNRWGDYSATVIDPEDPYTFWTFQEWVIADNTWATRITQLDVNAIPEPTTIALFGLGLLGLGAKLRRRKES